MSSNAGPSWLSEPAIAGFEQRAEVTAVLYRGASAYQRIEVYDTVPFGTALVLEGAVQTTSRDEYIYHEMLVHPALLGHPRPRRVLIIGGGDGGTLRRVLAHRVRRALNVELDPAVVEISARFLPQIADGAFQAQHGELLIGDGARFVNETKETFDVVLVDSTDPVGPAKVLFSSGFYRDVVRVLGPNGLLVTQSGSPTLMHDELREAIGALRQSFPFVSCYLANVPSYPGSLWSFLIAAKQPSAAALFTPRPDARSRATIERRYVQAGLATLCYSPDVHFASFALPRYIQSALEAGAAH